MKKALVIGLITISLLATTAMATAQETTRVTFSHHEDSTWSNSETLGGFIIDWDLSIVGNLTFPVNFNIHNDGVIDPDSDDDVTCRVTAPENEGRVAGTVIGSIDVTKSGAIPMTGHKEFKNTTSLQVTTPIGENKISLPPMSIPVEIPLLPPIDITLKLTLNLTSSIVANATVEGPATISKTTLQWMSNGDVETITVHSSSEAQRSDNIILIVKDISYDCDATLIAGLYVGGSHVMDSPPSQLERNIPSDGEITIPFNITVVPEFTAVGLIVTFMVATSAVLIISRKLRLEKLSMRSE